jgi:hypothetical protein
MQENPSKDRRVQIAGVNAALRIQNSGVRRVDAGNPDADRVKLRLSRGFPRGTPFNAIPSSHSVIRSIRPRMPGHLHDLNNLKPLFGLHE